MAQRRTNRVQLWPGRRAQWPEKEAVRLAKRAIAVGDDGLSAVIELAWDTQMRLGDIRALRPPR